MNSENLVTPKQFAERLYNEENVKVCDETIRNALRDEVIKPEIVLNGNYYIDFKKYRKYRPNKIGRPRSLC